MLPETFVFESPGTKSTQEAEVIDLAAHIEEVAAYEEALREAREQLRSVGEALVGMAFEVAAARALRPELRSLPVGAAVLVSIDKVEAVDDAHVAALAALYRHLEQVVERLK